MIKIIKWWEQFENSGSRKLKVIRSFGSQAGNDSRGYRKLMRKGADGVMAFGVFQALCQCMATLSQESRKKGEMRNSDGSVLDLDDICDLTRLPDEILSSAIDLLVAIQWIEKLEPLKNKGNADEIPTYASDLPVKPQHLPTASRHWKLGEEGREEERRGEERREISSGDSCPQTDGGEILEKIWNAVPQISRTRSSKLKLEKSWKKLKAAEKPDESTVLNALDAWNKSEHWINGFACGVHIWVADQQWLNLPEAATDKTAINQSTDNSQGVAIKYL